MTIGPYPLPRWDSTSDSEHAVKFPTENPLITAVRRAASTHTEVHSAYDGDLNALTSGARPGPSHCGAI